MTSHQADQVGHAAHALGFGGINWWAWDPHRAPMGWFLLDFALFVALLVYFTAKPLRSALRERHQSVRRAVTQAAANHAKATSEQQLWAQKLAHLDGELKQLESESRADGEAEVKQMLADAQAQASQLREDAHLQAQQQLRRAHEAVRRETLAEVLKLTETMVTRAITPDDQRALIQAAAGALPQLPHRKVRARDVQGAPS